MTHTPNDREAALRGAIARGWCHDKNAAKVMDVDLADAIFSEVRALLQSPTAPSFTTGHCENHKQPGGCQLHNLQCGYPKCDQRPVESPAAAAQGDVLQRMAGITDRATPSPASPEVDVVAESMGDYMDYRIASPEVGGLVEVEDEGWWNDDGDVYTWPIQVGTWGARIECHGKNPDDANALAIKIAAALAPSRQAGGEAVAWRVEYPDGTLVTLNEHVGKTMFEAMGATVTPLYTHPAPSAESAFVRVPREPTAHMIESSTGGWNFRTADCETLADERDLLRRQWAAMLAAAPTATDEGKAHG